MTVDEIIKHCDDYITSMNKYADTGNIGWWLEFYHAVLNGFRELKALESQPTDAISREAVMKCFKKWQPYMATRLWDYEQELKELLSVTPSYNSIKTELKPCEDCISRQAVIKTIKEMPNANPSYTHTCDVVDQQDLIDSIDDLPSVTPQASEDTVNKHILVNLEDIIKIYSDKKNTNALNGDDDAFIEAIRECQKFQPCEGCISREDIEKLKKYSFSYDTNTTIPKADLFVKIADIGDLPSVQPQRKRGKWIDGYCSECGKSCLCDGWGDDVESKFCPNCGSYNGGGEDAE